MHAQASPAPQGQCADTVLMIRPVRFASNPQTAATNAFQHFEEAPTGVDVQPRAAEEFTRLVAALRAAGVNVIELADTTDAWTPDSVFPNNWMSTHAEGYCVTYPMLAPNRRRERRMDVFTHALPAAGFTVREVVDLSPAEQNARFLEGTGSLVLDRLARVAYACRSARTASELAEDFARRFGFELVLFDARDGDGQEIYHTNVMMSVGETFAVVCAAAVVDGSQRAQLVARLGEGGREVIEIDFAQMAAYAGNVLQLATQAGGRVLALSQTAFDAFTPAQREVLARAARLVPVDIDTIERCAGGSVRCMLAEVHLPRGEGPAAVAHAGGNP